MLRGDANENSQKKKNKLLRSEAAHFLFCFLSCLKTMQKSVERAKKKEKSLQKQDGNTTQIHEINLIQNRRKLS